MKITDVLEKDYIVPELEAADKRGVLEELVNHLSLKVDGLDRVNLLNVLLDREKLGSTGIGYGVAIPHGKLKELNHLIVGFGRSPGGLDFESIDNQPAYLFFLILAPEDSTASHLKILARISRLLKDPSFRKRLLEVSSKDEIFEAIADEDKKF